MHSWQLSCSTKKDNVGWNLSRNIHNLVSFSSSHRIKTVTASVLTEIDVCVHVSFCMCVCHHITVLSAVSLAAVCVWVNVYPGAIHPKPGHMKHPCRAFSSHCNDAGGQQSHAEVIYAEVRALRSSCHRDQCQWKTRRTHFYSQLKRSWPLGSLSGVTGICKCKNLVASSTQQPTRITLKHENISM